MRLVFLLLPSSAYKYESKCVCFKVMFLDLWCLTCWTRQAPFARCCLCLSFSPAFLSLQICRVFHPRGWFPAIWTRGCLYVFFSKCHLICCKKKKKAYNIWIFPIGMSGGWVISELPRSLLWTASITCDDVSGSPGGKKICEVIARRWFGETEQCTARRALKWKVELEETKTSNISASASQ